MLFLKPICILHLLLLFHKQCRIAYYISIRTCRDRSIVRHTFASTKLVQLTISWCVLCEVRYCEFVLLIMGSADFLRLNDHPLFKNVRETLPKNIKKTQNIMCVKDDVLYSWDFQDNCILTLNIKAARNEEWEGVIHQTLLNI
ncbi:Nuclear pore component [Popillia japonica]|uniref:Nuclear pore component n=1 Tax=Popillia japonica TaxID=7064 RepID=A0AAW1IV08_POPJA